MAMIINTAPIREALETNIADREGFLGDMLYDALGTIDVLGYRVAMVYAYLDNSAKFGVKPNPHRIRGILAGGHDDTETQ